jgi:hypothetical protein
LLEKSKISTELLDACRAARFRVDAVPAPFFLCVDQSSTELPRLYELFPGRCGAFLTAFNPLSKHLSDRENPIAYGRLVTAPEGLPVRIIESASRHREGLCPGEKGTLALGLELEVGNRNMDTHT